MNDLFRIWLDSVAVIVKKQQEIASIRGENYNLFKVIHMTSNETSVHSAFISDLLNPKGLHGMGDKFLRLFLDTINTHGFIFELLGCKAEIEKDIGPKTDTTGGRLDIYLTNQAGQAIIIENKIYAGDQEAQILRYHNFAIKSHKNKHLLLYLSLDSLVHDIDYTTKGGAKLDEDFYTISYRDDILEWLYKCRQLAVDKPLLREGISHYINLVKYLTHTNMSAQATKEMTDIVVKDPEHIRNLNTYAKAIENAKKALTVKFWEDLFSKMYKNYGEELCIVQIDDEKRVIFPPTEEKMSQLAQDFKFKGDSNKNGYSFGLAIPIAKNASQQLMASIMVEGAVSFRVFVIESNNIIYYENENNSFRFLRDALIAKGENNEVVKWKSSVLYICAKRPNNELDPWYFSDMKNQTLENLSDMKSCIEKILQEFEAYIKSLNDILKEIM